MQKLQKSTFKPTFEYCTNEKRVQEENSKMVKNKIDIKKYF